MGFVGLEDSRIFRWEGDLYISGVRRDTTENGQGRMELSKIEVTEDAVKEVSRVRLIHQKIQIHIAKRIGWQLLICHGTM